MIERKNPTIVTNVDEAAITGGEIYNTAKPDFMMAVGANNFYTGDKNDMRYFKWILDYSVFSAEGSKQYYYELHPCTEEDLDKFYEPDTTSAEKIEKFKEQGGLFCFDWDSAALDLYGTWTSDVNYSAIDIKMMPCGT